MRLTRKDAQELIREIYKLTQEHNISLSDWEAKFIESVKFQSTQFKELTEKQSAALQNVYRNISDKAVR